MLPSEVQSFEEVLAYVERCAAVAADCRLHAAQLIVLLRRVFETAGASTDTAATIARTCALAEQDGALSHGLHRVPGYVATLRSGWVDARAVPELVGGAAATLVVERRTMASRNPPCSSRRH